MKKVTTPVTGPAALALRWVPVTSGGRTRMEMRWSAPPAVTRRARA